MKDFILQHATMLSFIGAYLFLGLVSCLPKPGDPRPVSAKLYDGFYQFLHLISNRVAEKQPAAAATLVPKPVVYGTITNGTNTPDLPKLP